MKVLVEKQERSPFSTLCSFCVFVFFIAIFLTRGSWTFVKVGRYFGAETLPRGVHGTSHHATQQVPPWRASSSDPACSSMYSALWFSPLSRCCWAKSSHDCSIYKQPWLCFCFVSSGTVELCHYRAQSKPTSYAYTQHHSQVDIVYSEKQGIGVWHMTKAL